MGYNDPYLWASNPLDNGNNEPNVLWLGAGGDRFFFADPQFHGPGYALYELQRQEPVSAMQLTFKSAHQSFAIGNPWGGDANRVFDSLFFSTLPRQLSDADEDANPKDLWTGAFPNPYIHVYQDKFNPAKVGRANQGLETAVGNAYYREDRLSGMMRADQSAANLLLRGGFNVNSTSEEAWRVMLSGISLGDPADPSATEFRYRGNAPFPRTDDKGPQRSLYRASPGEGDASGSTILNNAHFKFPQSADSMPYFYDRDALERLASDASYGEGGASSALKEFQQVVLSQGVRELTDDQVEFLAREVVAEIEKYARGEASYTSRGGQPFTSVREFMESGILDNVLDPSNYGDPQEHPNFAVRLFSYAPAYVTQGQILTGIAPLLTPRSDTFTIRGFGSSNDGKARAYCEMVVQRVPTPVNTDVIPIVEDPSNESAYRDQKLAINNLTESLHPFGRQFKIVSFRWLDESTL